ncbi:LPS export ABC transporter periplasmic protein LptC [Conservatibacter flavescens]|uniref:Lipopolysaccharide export system protein LptC n=1 Tax=Conservatibacter flavescens TaxID=28161 RepID=A0A2M8S350_9PAST|nr:LPS export ABC transporter periplasmic protein LptC [Conservatibacter flavescens]PJG85556.1 LPS export ABC transporter periplasmic protein LptC [Conservatibacter flavescens]
MNIRWNIILGLIVLVLLGWFYSLNQSNHDLSELIKKDESPEYVGQKMETILYSPTGKKQYVGRAETVSHYDNDGHTEFTKPILYLYDIEGKNAEQQSWMLSADTAVLTKDRMLYLEGNVVAKSLLPDSRLQRVETEKAQFNLTTHDISSDTMVKINGQNFITTGQKLTGNLQQQIATLKEQVKTYYEVNNQ